MALEHSRIAEDSEDRSPRPPTVADSTSTGNGQSHAQANRKSQVRTIEQTKSILTLSLSTTSQHASSPVSMIPLRRTHLRGFSRVSLRESRCRLLSSAPFRVRPHAWSTKNDQPEPVALTIFGWAVRGSACCAGGRCGASRLARCAGKCLRISSAPRPDGFDPMRG